MASSRLSKFVPARARASWKNLRRTPRRQAAALLRLGIFDADYYRGVLGLAPMTEEEAAEHYVTNLATTKLSPHPLIEWEAMPDKIRKAVVDPDGVERLARYLRLSAARSHAWSAVFDPRSLPTHQIADPLAALITWPDDAPLPMPRDFPGVAPTLAHARTEIARFMREHRRQSALTLPPRRPAWDDDETAQWIDDHRNAPRSNSVVSVIMPALDRQDTIAAAVDSVLAQTHKAVELIVVDDGSTDGTADIVAAYAKRDDRVRLIAGPHAGVGSARNTGVAEARGDFVAFLDSDNTWSPRFLELSLVALESDESAVASHAGTRLHGANGSVQYRGGDVQWDQLQLGNSIDINVLVARATAMAQVGPSDPTIRRWVDYDLVLRLASVGRLVYVPVIGCDYDDRPSDGRITQRETIHWQWSVRSRNVVGWSAMASGADNRVAGRASVIIVIAGAVKHTTGTVSRLLGSFSGDLEVVVVDNGSSAAIGRRVAASFAGESRVRVVRLPVNNNFALAANYGASLTTGEHLIFVDSDADPRDGWLDALLQKKQEIGAFAIQSLVTNPDGTVQSAGAAFFPREVLPSSLLAGLPPQDAEIVDLTDLTAVRATAMAIGATDFASLQGFDALYANGLEDIDLCLRARKKFPERARFACAPASVVPHAMNRTEARAKREPENTRIFEQRWGDEELRDDSVLYDPLDIRLEIAAPAHGETERRRPEVLVRSPREVVDRQLGEIPAFRWAIKTGVPTTRGGDRWGDIPFADDLARSLRARGQQVGVDRFPARDRPTSVLDDVVLTLRGRHPIAPQTGAINIMWVISRPDLVTPDELDGYDIVVAASAKWAQWMSEISRRDVGVLLQATDPTRFHPDLTPVEHPDDVLFVGGARPIPRGRAIVGMALDAGAPVGLWGPGWDKLAPAENVRESTLPFEVTPRAYQSAQIVLNDHFPDMAEWGFVNNRTFDAIASGTPMISDPVDGLELFEGAVATADSIEQMRDLVSDRSWMPSPQKMRALSEMVRTEHSFEARASTLLKWVVDVSRERSKA